MRIKPFVLVPLAVFVIGCSRGKSTYYQGNQIEIISQSCNALSECQYKINYEGTELTVSESQIEWR